MEDTSARLREGWPSFLLVWAMLLITSLALLQADLTDGLYIVPIAATLALVAGWLLGKSIFTERTAHLMAIIYGLFFVTWLVGSTLPYEGTWHERVLDLVGRQVLWLQEAFDGGTSRDGIIFVIQTTAVFWLIGYLAGWYTFREMRVWRVVVPIGVVLLSVVYYYNGPKPMLIYLAIYTLLALLYIVITYLTGEETRWRRESVRYDRAIQFDFLRAGLLAALLALLLAWSLPGLQASANFTDAVAGAGSPWRTFQDTWTRLFSSLRSYGAGSSDPYQDTLVLGGPRTVGNSPIMDVRVSEELPYGVYWQAIVYDTYVDGSWRVASSPDEPLVHYPEDGALDVPVTVGREIITQTVTTYMPNSTFLYAAPEVISTDKQMLVDATYDENGNTLVTALRSRFMLRQGDEYNVVSRVSTADATALRAASTTYPQWVQERYLQVPAGLTPQTLDLAAQLAEGQATPYDKAIAIRDYLRTNIKYNDQINAAPEGVEPIHYTLFDLKQGYCTYYASAMAMMLRTQGVPSRVVSGYALGEYTPEAKNYRVRAVNAHTWVEVYFPGYGWIHFEPTQSIPVVERPEAGQATSGLDPAMPIPNNERALTDDELADLERADGLMGDLSSQPERGLLGNVAWWQVAIGAALLVAAGGALRMANQYNQEVEGDVGRSFLRLGEWSRILGIPWRATQTPYEQADSLVAVVPQGQQSIRNLTRQYVLQLFSPARSTDADFDPRQEWRALRPVLMRQTIVKTLNRWRGQKNQSG